ncbi:GGDEF domain-containing protein [Candidatus Dojkabacteria bacterium]|jgi:diguanylate cyclase (GGDEF)-like protein|nr:GGDEF domain-containing protein [Candidatus Dojkabacteria bacterium]
MEKQIIFQNKITIYSKVSDIPSKYLPQNIPFRLKENESINLPFENEEITIKKENGKYIFSKINLKPFLELQKNAITDEQTGVLNRYAYHEVLKPFLYDNARHGYDIGILFVDIDDLKTINSEKGYLHGDKVIVGIAKTLFKTMRKSDLIVRLGGDEFLVILALMKGVDELKPIAHRVIKECKTKKSLASVSIGAKVIGKEEVNKLLDNDDWRIIWDEHVEYSNRYNRNAKELGKGRLEIN